jgi:hypothetical protein
VGDENVGSVKTGIEGIGSTTESDSLAGTAGAPGNESDGIAGIGSASSGDVPGPLNGGGDDGRVIEGIAGIDSGDGGWLWAATAGGGGKRATESARVGALTEVIV